LGGKRLLDITVFALPSGLLLVVGPNRRQVQTIWPKQRMGASWIAISGFSRRRNETRLLSLMADSLVDFWEHGATAWDASSGASKANPTVAAQSFDRLAKSFARNCKWHIAIRVLT
jgi:hypothetical protein